MHRTYVFSVGKWSFKCILHLLYHKETSLCSFRWLKLNYICLFIPKTNPAV